MDAVVSGSEQGKRFDRANRVVDSASLRARLLNLHAPDAGFADSLRRR